MCDLTLTSLDGLDPDRDRVFEMISKTFALIEVDFLAHVESKPLLSEAVRRPPSFDAIDATGVRRKFPCACVSLYTPTGWDVTDEEGNAVFRRGGAEIRLSRFLSSDGDVDTWFSQRMEQFQNTKSLLLGFERGVLERGDYAAVLYENKGGARSWKTAAVMKSLDVFVNDEQPLLWTLHANAGEFENHQPRLESLLAEAEFLSQDEWEIKLAEPWIDLTLKGPWKTQGPGLYVTTVPTFTSLYLLGYQEKCSIETLHISVGEAVKQDAGVQQTSVEDEAVGLWKGQKAFRISFEGVSENAEKIFIRAAWIHPQLILYNLILQARDRKVADELFIQLLDSLCFDRVAR